MSGIENTIQLSTNGRNIIQLSTAPINDEIELTTNIKGNQEMESSLKTEINISIKP